jgi:hypothetical protein
MIDIDWMYAIRTTVRAGVASDILRDDVCCFGTGERVNKLLIEFIRHCKDLLV